MPLKIIKSEETEQIKTANKESVINYASDSVLCWCAADSVIYNKYYGFTTPCNVTHNLYCMASCLDFSKIHN